jgi:hypothetical protein
MPSGSKKMKTAKMIRVYSRGSFKNVEASRAPANLVRLAFPDGPVFAPLDELLTKTEPGRRIELEKHVKRLREHIEAKAVLDVRCAEIERKIKADGRKTARENRRTKNAKRDAKILVDIARFNAAFASYEQQDLPDLLDEFNVPIDRRPTFRPNNVALAIANSRKYNLTTAAQVRNIMRAKTR